MMGERVPNEGDESWEINPGSDQPDPDYSSESWEEMTLPIT